MCGYKTGFAYLAALSYRPADHMFMHRRHQSERTHLPPGARLVTFTVIGSRRSVRCMMTFIELAPAASDPPEPFTDRLRLAVAAYLARFTGSSREHTDSDLRRYLTWCAEQA